jgi:hypothetical protein
MEAPAPRSTARLLRPILPGLLGSFLAFWAICLGAMIAVLTLVAPD